MTQISADRAIDIYSMVANDAYVCHISSPNGNNQETRTGNGSDMMTAIESGEYSEYYLEEADKSEAVSEYTEMAEAGEINGDGYADYDYHRLTVCSNSIMEIAFIPVGGW